MAVRHAIPIFEPSIEGPLIEDVSLQRFPSPTSVGFRSGADLSGVIDAIRQNARVLVDAAVGAGKSTVLPYQVAENLKTMVLQVFPNAYLASDVSDYCKSVGKQSVFVEKPEEDFPEQGVVCIGAPTLVARWLSMGQATLPECVVFHDEAHESDAYTYLVKNIAGGIGTVQSYVTATATSKGAGFRQMEAAGKVNLNLLPPDKFRSEWDIYGDDPWAVTTLEGHMLIFEDVKKRAEALLIQYRQAGLNAFRLHSRMTLQEFRHAMATVRDRRSALTVLVADNSFRSGFTFPVTRIIDFATVVNKVVSEGKPIWNARSAYELECYQAMGRGGRIAGLATQYYRPDAEIPSFVCDLEQTEVNVAALCFRLLGYKVPQILGSAEMSRGKVPRNLARALREATPLAVLLPSQLVELNEFFSVQGRRSPFLKANVDVDMRPVDVTNHMMSADVAYKHGMGGLRMTTPSVPDVIQSWESQMHLDEAKAQPVSRQSWESQMSPDDYARARPVAEVQSHGRSSHVRVDSADSTPKPLFSGSGQVDAFDYRQDMAAVADTIRSFTQFEDPVNQLDAGKYYYASGLHTEHNVCAAFPEGSDSVCKWLSRDISESVHFGLSSYERSVALNALLLKYNIKTCEMRVLSKAIPAAKTRAVGKDMGSLRIWATEMSGSIVAVMTELKVLSKYVIRLADRFCGVCEMAPMHEAEESGFSSVMRSIDDLPSADTGPPTGMLSAFRNEWSSVPIGYVSSLSSSSSSAETKALENLPMPTRGKGMRALPRSGASLNTSKRSVTTVGKDSNGRQAFVRKYIGGF